MRAIGCQSLPEHRLGLALSDRSGSGGHGAYALADRLHDRYRHPVFRPFQSRE